MKSFLFDIAPEDLDYAIGELWEAGTAGIQEESSGLRAFFHDDADLTGIARRYRLLDVRDEAPYNASKAPPPLCEPILAGDRFLIAPPSYAGPVEEGRLRLTVEAGAAFGTGRHETTQLMLQVLERELRPGAAVADVGCGSGILSQAALLLGAGKVAACDIDPQFLPAIPAALRPHVFAGSADAIRDGVADVVLANISAKVIDALAYDLNRIAKPGGLLVLSGFIRDRVPDQFRPQAELSQGDWLCWLCRRVPVDLKSRPPVQVHERLWY